MLPHSATPMPQGGPPPPMAPGRPLVPSPVPIGARAEQAFDPPAGMVWARVSTRLTWHRRISVLLWALPVTIVGAFVFSLALGLVGGLIWLAMIFVSCAMGWIIAELSYRSWGFAERADDLLVTHGFFVRHLVVVPYGRMQYVDVTAGLLEQWLGVATVRLHTAAAATDARIPGLPARDAAVLRDRLAQKGESRSIGL
jgi:membrane protein YdbS with pleckstrin-like domain